MTKDQSLRLSLSCVSLLGLQVLFVCPGFMPLIPTLLAFMVHISCPENRYATNRPFIRSIFFFFP